MSLRRFFPSTVRGVEVGQSWLDGYPGARFVFSIRKAYASYSGPCLKVRRDGSSPAELDIGFDSDGYMDLSALTSFVGSDTGFVTTIYDQSGNGFNASNSDSNTQPTIIIAGTLQTFYGKPTIYFDRTRGDFLRWDSGTNVNIIPDNRSVGEFGENSLIYTLGLDTTLNTMWILSDNGSFFGFTTSSGSTNTNVSSNYQLSTERFKVIINETDQNPANRGQSYTAFNGNKIVAEKFVGLPDTNSMRIGRSINAGFYFQGRISDMISYPLNLSDIELKAVSALLNNYYLAY